MSQEQSAAVAFPQEDLAGLRSKRGIRNALIGFARKKPLGAFGGVVSLILIVVAIFAPVIKTHDEYKPIPGRVFAAPSSEALFGGDDLGRDVFSRIIMGTRISLKVGLISAFVGCTLGLMVGVGSAYFGGLTDLLVQRVIDGMIAFPALVLAIAIMAALGSSLNNVIIALTILFVPSTARIIRAQALAVTEMDYVLAARSVGARHGRIILWHIIPNCLAVVIVIFTFQLGIAIIAEASLSFLGLGVGPDEPSWGSMLRGASKNYIGVGPWLPVFPGLAIAIVVFAWNLLGDSLRDVLDPRLRGTD